MAAKPIRIVATFELRREEGPSCDEETLREAFDDELQSQGEVYAQDPDQEQESQYGVELISTEVAP